MFHLVNYSFIQHDPFKHLFGGCWMMACKQSLFSFSFPKSTSTLDYLLRENRGSVNMLEQSETNLLIPSERASPQKFEERLNCLRAREAGYCHIWAIEVCAAVNGMVFKQFTLGQDIKKRVWVQNRVSFSRELQSRLWKPGIAIQKYQKIKSASLNLRNSA